jgi:hypothetical protein
MGFWTDFKNDLDYKEQVKRNESLLASSNVSEFNSVTDRCIDLDRKIKDYDVLIADLSKRNIKRNMYGDLIRQYSDKRKELQLQFIQLSCVDKIEVKKLRESADVLGTGFSQYEQDILEKSRKEQNKLYLIGGGVLLLGLYLIVK